MSETPVFAKLSPMSKADVQLPAYEDMIKAGMHFGRKKTVFHPGMEPFVHTLKEGVHILDLIKTGDFLLRASDFINKCLGDGKLILFVGLTKQSIEAVKTTAEALNMPYAVERWLGGTLTNFKTISSRVKYLEELEKKQASGDFEKYTKKERLMKEKEIEKLRKKFNGLRKLIRMPDAIFVTSLRESQLAIKEARLAKIKTIGIVNTDSDPNQLDFPIPANDNSKKSVELVMSVIKDKALIGAKN